MVAFFVSKFIKFEWFKNGPFKNDLISDLLYHDLYILNSFLNISNIYFEFIINEKNHLHLSHEKNNCCTIFSQLKNFILN